MKVKTEAARSRTSMDWRVLGDRHLETIIGRVITPDFPIGHKRDRGGATSTKPI